MAVGGEVTHRAKRGTTSLVDKVAHRAVGVVLTLRVGVLEREEGTAPTKKFFGQETLREGQVSVRVSMQESASFQH